MSNKTSGIKLDGFTHEPRYRIGEIATITGASQRAIRLYEAKGLIPAPTRKGNYRMYTDHDAFLVHVIKKSQAIGFKLSELKELLARQSSDKQFPLELANRLFDNKRVQFEQQIEAIRELQRQLAEMQQQMNQLFK